MTSSRRRWTMVVRCLYRLHGLQLSQTLLKTSWPYLRSILLVMEYIGQIWMKISASERLSMDGDRGHGVPKSNAAGASIPTKGRRGKGINAVAHHAAVSTSARYVLVPEAGEAVPIPTCPPTDLLKLRRCSPSCSGAATGATCVDVRVT